MHHISFRKESKKREEERVRAHRNTTSKGEKSKWCEVMRERKEAEPLRDRIKEMQLVRCEDK